MRKIISIFKNKELLNRIIFTIMILLIIRIGAAIKVPGVKVSEEIEKQFTEAGAIALMDLLGGGALQHFSIFALGVSPYITAQIIVQLLSKDVLPALTELSRQGEYGRKKSEMATRYLTLLLGAVQAYGVIKTMENNSYITVNNPTFWGYAYIIIIILAGSMLMMWLGDQITSKGLGNGISVIIFAGCVRSLPLQMKAAFQKWILDNQGKGSSQLLRGGFQFLIYILVFVLIISFVVFIELSKRKIPVQHSGRGGANPSMARASFLPIKVNSAGVIPVIFASSIMLAPSVIASFISADAAKAEWLKIFSYSEFTNVNGVKIPFGLFIYLILTVLFCFFYASIQINPQQLAENFQKSGSYIPGIRPGVETEKYVAKVLNRVTCLGAISLALIAGLPVILTLAGVFKDAQGNNTTILSLGGTSLIIVVGVAIELNAQIDGLLAGKSFEEVQAGGANL